MVPLRGRPRSLNRAFDVVRSSTQLAPAVARSNRTPVSNGAGHPTARATAPAFGAPNVVIRELENEEVGRFRGGRRGYAGRGVRRLDRHPPSDRGGRHPPAAQAAVDRRGRSRRRLLALRARDRADARSHDPRRERSVRPGHRSRRGRPGRRRRRGHRGARGVRATTGRARRRPARRAAPGPPDAGRLGPVGTRRPPDRRPPRAIRPLARPGGSLAAGPARGPRRAARAGHGDRVRRASRRTRRGAGALAAGARRRPRDADRAAGDGRERHDRPARPERARPGPATKLPACAASGANGASGWRTRARS